MAEIDKRKKVQLKAEKLIEQLGSGKKKEDLSPSDIRSLLQELVDHQKELDSHAEDLANTQNRLREENKKYVSLFNYAPIGFVVLDAKGRVRESNKTFCEMVEQPLQNVLREDFRSFLHADSIEPFELHLDSLLNEGSKGECVLKILSRTGDYKWVKMESSCYYSVHPHQHIQCSLSDITQTKENEEHLLRLSAAFEQSANSVVITDLEGNIEYANPRFFESTGFSYEEIIGENPRIVKHPDSKINYKELWDTITAGKTWKGEFLNQSKNGQLFWEIATITPVKNEKGTTINYLAIKEDITQRKKAERKLHKAKDFYLNLLEDFPVMVWQSDTRGVFNFFNKTLQEFTGVDFTKNGPHGFLEHIHEKDRKIFLDGFKKSRKEKTHFVVEFRMLDKYQNYRWILNHAKPFSDMEGNYGGFIASCIDIHDRRMMEKRLMESEDKSRRMFEDSSLGIFKLDRNFSFVSANKAFAEMFGYENTVDFLIDINNRPELFFQDFKKETEFRRSLVKSKKNRFVLEREFKRKDQSTIHTVIHLRKVYERDRSKEFYMEGFIEDISKRKKAEKQLLLSEQKFKALFEKSYDAVLILEHDSTIIDCNWKAADLFQVKREMLIGKKYAELTPNNDSPEHDAETFLCEKTELALQGKAQNFEWLHRKDNKTFDAEVSMARIYLRNQFMVQVIVRDISEKKRAEKQIKQAKEDAEKARMAQSEFLSLMSHEIRTPLNTVVALTDLMLDEVQTTEQQENLSRVKISARHLLELIDDILDYNKIESGNIEFEHETFRLRDFVEDVAKIFEVKAKEKDIALTWEVKNVVPDVLKADTLRLKQVLYNMLSNAIKFTEPGGKVSLLVDQPSPKDNKVFFEVNDTGIGISDDKLNDIFEKFTQAESSITRKYGGSGLGLAICKKLVELQGGQIFAQSKPGEGTSISFNLPMMKGNKKELPAVEKVSAGGAYSLGNMRILMIEDDKMNQFVARKIIEKKWNANLEIASTGEEGLELLKKNRYQLILLDILLPDITGFEIAENLRKNENQQYQNPDTPIIALTADAFLETRKKAETAGVDDFLSKPFDYHQLFEVINKYRLV